MPPRRRSPRAAAAAAPPQGPPAPPPGRGGPSRTPRRRHRRNHQLRLPAAPGLPLPGRRRQCLAPRWPPLPGPAVRSCGWRGRASPPPPGGRPGPPAQRGPRHRTALHRSQGPGTLSRYCTQVWEGFPGVWGALWVSKTVGFFCRALFQGLACAPARGSGAPSATAGGGAGRWQRQRRRAPPAPILRTRGRTVRPGPLDEGGGGRVVHHRQRVELIKDAVLRTGWERQESWAVERGWTGRGKGRCTGGDSGSREQARRPLAVQWPRAAEASVREPQRGGSASDRASGYGGWLARARRERGRQLAHLDLGRLRITEDSAGRPRRRNHRASHLHALPATQKDNAAAAAGQQQPLPRRPRAAHAHARSAPPCPSHNPQWFHPCSVPFSSTIPPCSTAPTSLQYLSSRL